MEPIHYSNKTTLHDTFDKFLQFADSLNEFFTLRERMPRQKSSNIEEKKLANKIMNWRVPSSSIHRMPHKQVELNNVNPAILNSKIKYEDEIEPSVEWIALFKKWKEETNEDDLRAYKFPTINEPYIPTAGSVQEHIVRKTGCYRFFQPSECHPKTTPGTMKNVISYLVHPEQRYKNQHKCSTSVLNAFEEQPPSPLHHKYSGTLFSSDTTSSLIKSLLSAAYRELFDGKDFIADVRACQSVLNIKRYCTNTNIASIHLTTGNMVLQYFT